MEVKSLRNSIRSCNINFGMHLTNNVFLQSTIAMCGFKNKHSKILSVNEDHILHRGELKRFLKIS